MPAILDKILRIGEGKILRQLEAISRAVNAIEEDFVAMSDEELQGQTAEFKRRLAEGETLDELMPEAFATVREAAKRLVAAKRPVIYAGQGVHWAEAWGELKELAELLAIPVTGGLERYLGWINSETSLTIA